LKLRSHSIQRSGNHTFEYTGFGPGNYSTAFPQTQVEVLSADQIKLSQSLKEGAGVSFYSGLNSNGDLFIGNQIINPVTGQITSDDVAQLNIIGEENTTIQTFSEVILTDKLTVLGGASNQLESLFAGPVTFQGKITSDSNLQVRKLSYSNPDGTILKSTLMAPDLMDLVFQTLRVLRTTPLQLMVILYTTHLGLQVRILVGYTMEPLGISLD
jgi:hypothetical protein